MDNLDHELQAYSKDQLIEEVIKLRNGIRKHRDCNLHELCWHHPELWSLLPEKVEQEIIVPEWPQFLRGCLQYRQSLDEQMPDSPRSLKEFKTKS